MDIQLLKDQLAGLEAKGKRLRSDEALFLKAQGLDESIETARTKLGEDETDNINFKEQMAELKHKKSKAIGEACIRMQEKMTAILPEGMAVIHIDDEGVLLIGWLKPGAKAPVAYHSLSGGEKAIFEAALVHALEADLVIIEAAELDEKNLVTSLEKLSGLDAQVLLSTCHAPAEVPNGWEVVKL
jgi:hypothetical protein